MSKIKRVFTIEQETKRLRLVQSINDKCINEAGVMDTLKKGVAAVADKASTWAKGSTPNSQAAPAPSQQAEQEKDVVDSFQTGDANTRDISAIANQIMQTGNGSVRYVLSMTSTDLKKFYLKSGGGADAANMIVAVSQDKDNAFTNLAKSVKSNKIGRFVLVDGAHPSLVKSFSAGSKLNMMILLNVPANISKQFSMATDENAAKEAFTNMMSHKFYVGTINRDKMGINGATAMDAALGSEEKIIAAFDPHWLEHWRDNAMRVKAVNEWDNVHSDEAKDAQAAAQSDKLIARSERAKKEREAQDNIDNASVNKTEAAIKSIIFSAADKESIKNSLSGSISSNKFTRDDALATVEKMKGILNTDTYEFLVNNIKGPSADSSSDAAAKQAKIDAEKARKANKNKP